MRSILVVLVLFVLLAIPAGAGIPSPGVIDVTSSVISKRMIDGKSVTISRIFNERIQPGPIGSVIAVCVYLGKGGVLGGGTDTCEVTYSLPRGKIVAQGLVKDRSFYQLAVLGGVGLYANVGGQVTVFSLGPSAAQLIFTLEAI